MKKVLIALAVCVSLVACKNEAGPKPHEDCELEYGGLALEELTPAKARAGSFGSRPSFRSTSRSKSYVPYVAPAYPNKKRKRWHWDCD